MSYSQSQNPDKYQYKSKYNNQDYYIQNLNQEDRASSSANPNSANLKNYPLAQTDSKSTLQNALEFLQELEHSVTKNTFGYVQYILGKSYFEGNMLVDKDYKKAKDFFKSSAQKGYIESFYLLAVLHAIRFGPDNIKVLDLFQKAADSNYAPAQYQLAMMQKNKYEIAKEIKYDYKYWITKSAKNNYVLAQYELGLLHFENKKFKKSIFWFKQAAKQKHAPSQYFIGKIYYIGGFGLVKNNRKAFDWWQLAAEQDYKLAITALKSMAEIRLN